MKMTLGFAAACLWVVWAIPGMAHLLGPWPWPWWGISAFLSVGFGGGMGIIGAAILLDKRGQKRP